MLQSLIIQWTRLCLSWEAARYSYCLHCLAFEAGPSNGWRVVPTQPVMRPSGIGWGQLGVSWGGGQRTLTHPNRRPTTPTDTQPPQLTVDRSIRISVPGQVLQVHRCTVLISGCAGICTVLVWYTTYVRVVESRSGSVILHAGCRIFTRG